MATTNAPDQSSGLSAQTIAVVKSTAPVLALNGEILTRHFYQRMFRENPEVKSLFNPRNQAGGTQQRALAGAICAFAANVDRLEVLGSAVERIAQKHAGLGILPEHYPIVGENLLASIREVLGAAATPEIIGAWAEAYGFLAGILIGREREIYQSQEAGAYGWSGFKRFRLMRKEPESAVIASLYFQPADGGKLPFHKPGQYLTVRVPDGVSGSTMRNYSLSSAPCGDYFRISVKREPEGLVSGYLHRLEPGAEIEIGPPCGEFFLDLSEADHRPLVLLSAGVGITPVLAMLEAALQANPDRRIIFIHGARNGRTHAFGPQLRDLAAKHPGLTIHFRFSSPDGEDLRDQPHHSEGRIDAALIESLVPSKDGDFYFCGPKLFMGAVYRQLLAWGIPGPRIHFEFFGPREELETAC